MHRIVGLSVVAAAMVVIAGCSASSSDAPSEACSRVPCGSFDVAQAKESSPIYLAGAPLASLYRICVREGSVILQMIDATGTPQSIGAEIRGGSCADVSFGNTVYIVGNTGNGRATGFYYRVP